MPIDGHLAHPPAPSDAAQPPQLNHAVITTTSLAEPAAPWRLDQDDLARHSFARTTPRAAGSTVELTAPICQQPATWTEPLQIAWRRQEPPPLPAGLPAELIFWWRLSGATEPPPIFHALDVAAAHILQQALQHMRRSRDFTEPSLSHYLALQMCTWLRAAAADPALFLASRDYLNDSLDQCADRASLNFNSLSVLSHLHWAERSNPGTAGLRHLGVRFLKLEIVHAHARRCSRTAPNQEEEVEVQLLFETALLRVLDLPLMCEDMHYSSSVDVPSAALTAATQAAVAAAADPVAVDAFLADWAPWRRHQRELQSQVHTWAHLPAQALAEHGDWLTPTSRCPITLERLDELAQPVCIGPAPSHHVFDCAALLRWWATEGSHPVLVRQPLELDQIHRLSIPAALARGWRAKRAAERHWQSNDPHFPGRPI